MTAKAKKNLFIKKLVIFHQRESNIFSPNGKNLLPTRVWLSNTNFI